MTSLLERLGLAALFVLEELGRFFYIVARSFAWMVRPPFDLAQWMKQMVRVGFDSIPVVFLTTMFTGMVLALQTYRGFERFHAEGFVASVVALSLTRELSPVLTGLMVAGRVGSSMAAELGTMRVTEQIDALYAMATEPVHYLVVPRVGAAVLMLPLLTLVGDAIGILGGWLVAVGLFERQQLPVLGAHLPVPGGQRRHLRPDQGRVLRLHPGGHRLLQGLLHLGRRRRRRAGDHGGGGDGVAVDPAVRLLPHQDPVLRRRDDDHPRAEDQRHRRW